MKQKKYIVAQLGARRHYGVPRILAEAKMLEHFYTDICAVKGWPRWLNLLPKTVQPPAVRRLLGRIPHKVPLELITTFDAFGREYGRRRKATTSDTFAVYLWAGQEFCQQVIRQGFGQAEAVYTFNSAGLEILQSARHDGLETVMEQTIAPMRFEMDLMKEERKLNPGWETNAFNEVGGGAYCEREEAEWQAAHKILCGSEFVREGIRLCGGPVEKCVVVPFGVNPPYQEPENRSRKSENGISKADIGKRPLHVLTVGAVGLRKGSPYVLAAAKQLKGRAIFRMVGGIEVAPAAEAELRLHLELTGPVPRSEISRQFGWADVFLLPSLCEGSAMVTYEALGHGLPVICTPNTGSVVHDGEDGFIVPARDVAGIVARLQMLADDSPAMEELSAQARRRASEYTMAEYSRRLLAAL